MSQALPPSYFEQMYLRQDDPWDFAHRWYERRKRSIVLASLPQRWFHRVFEPGCSTGELSRELANRCDQLLATDVADKAVAACAATLSRCPHARVERMHVPREWPTGRFDLIVVSEIAYYLDDDGARTLGSLAAQSLTDDGTLVVCHWRHPVRDYPLPGDVAQARVLEGAGLTPQVLHIEPDFTLHVLTPAHTPWVATREGLVEP